MPVYRNSAFPSPGAPFQGRPLGAQTPTFVPPPPSWLLQGGYRDTFVCGFPPRLPQPQQLGWFPTLRGHCDNLGWGVHAPPVHPAAIWGGMARALTPVVQAFGQVYSFLTQLQAGASFLAQQLAVPPFAAPPMGNGVGWPGYTPMRPPAIPVFQPPAPPQQVAPPLWPPVPPQQGVVSPPAPPAPPQGVVSPPSPPAPPQRVVASPSETHSPAEEIYDRASALARSRGDEDRLFSDAHALGFFSDFTEPEARTFEGLAHASPRDRQALIDRAERFGVQPSSEPWREVVRELVAHHAPEDWDGLLAVAEMARSAQPSLSPLAALRSGDSLL
jgi:hypothetical protein